MPIGSIRRRIRALESVLLFASVMKYPPLSPSEIESIAGRVKMGRGPTGEEVTRLEQQSPVIQAELLISAHHGNVFVKRYRGIDVAAI